MKEIAYKSIIDGGYAVDDDTIIKNFVNVVPLSKTNPEKIEAIRNWGKDRAVPASGVSLENDNTENKRKVLI